MACLASPGRAAKRVSMGLRHSGTVSIVCVVALAGPIPLQCSVLRIGTTVYYKPSLFRKTQPGNQVLVVRSSRSGSAMHAPSGS